MATQKRILVCATSGARGDWPPLAAVTVGLHGPAGQPSVRVSRLYPALSQYTARCGGKEE